MISLELARMLYDAGLTYEPKVTPTLGQLLDAIEKRGWQADSVQTNGKYACDIAYLSETVHTKYQTFAGDTREDAVARALLWVEGSSS